MTVGERLCALRTEKGLSEEQFANWLGVSYKDILHWEGGKEEPPLSLLPKIAAYFETTTDHLLGMDELDRDELIAPYLEKYQTYICDGKLPEAIAVMRDGLIHFPKSDKLKCMLMYALYLSCTRPAVVKHYTGEIFSLAEEILGGCTDDTIRLEAKRVLCLHCFDDLHDREKALEIAKTLPSRKSCREDMIAHIADEKQKKRLLQQNVIAYGQLLTQTIGELAATDPTLTEEALTLSIKLTEALTPEGDYLHNELRLMQAHRDLGLLFLKNGKTDDGFAHLKKAADHAASYDRLEERTPYRSPLLKGLQFVKGRSDPPELGSASTAAKALLDSMMILDSMEELRYDPRLREILTELTEK